MNSKQAELIADWILEHQDATQEQAIAALRRAGAWPDDGPRVDPEPTLGPAPAETFGAEVECADEDAVAPAGRLLPLAPEDPFAVGAGLETFGADDVRISQLKLKQAQTKNAAGVPDGAWFLSSDLEGHSLARELVLLELGKERSLLLPFGGGVAADAMIQRILAKTGAEVPDDWEGPVCFSRDRVTPVVQEGIKPLAAACSECPLNGWRTVRGRRMQDCAESYRLLVLDVTSGLPAVLYARGSAIRPVRDLLTGLQVACRRQNLPAYGFRFTVASKRLEGGDGTYHVPVFGRLAAIDDKEEIARYAGIRKACATVQVEDEAA